jgi:hypothetical protein
MWAVRLSITDIGAVTMERTNRGDFNVENKLSAIRRWHKTLRSPRLRTR